MLINSGRAERHVIDNGDVDNNSGLHGAFSGTVRYHGAGRSCLWAAGLAMMGDAVRSRADCCSRMGQWGVGTRHVC